MRFHTRKEGFDLRGDFGGETGLGGQEVCFGD